MSTLVIKLSGDARKVIAGLRGFPAEMAAAIAGALNLANDLTVGRIQKDRLSQRGPETLGVRTNRLRSSVRRTQAVVNGVNVESSIGSNVTYASVHEFGFQGEVQVGSFVRKNPRGNVFVRGPRGGKGKQVSSGVSTVRAHKSRRNIKARAPFRRGIESNSARYASALSAAVVQGWQKANQA